MGITPAKDWTHPRLENVDAAKDAWDDLAEEAQAAYQRRYASYPDLVKAGRIDAVEARADLLAWRAIAKDWRWIAHGDGAPADYTTMEARMKALDTAIERWLELIASGDRHLYPRDFRQGEALCAMRWWAERERASFDHTQHPRDRARRADLQRKHFGHPTRGEAYAARHDAQVQLL